jgi:hypothetical protein
LELLPGEGSAIDVIFDPSGRAGDLAKHISVVSNAQPDAVTRLTISAHVEATVRVDTQILNLGRLRLGRENRTYFNVYYRNPRVEITRIEVDKPHLTARLAGPRTESPVNEQGEYSATIEVVVDKDAPWGVIDRANLTFDQALKVHAIPRGSYASPRPAEGWWLLTRGAADALDMGDRIGSLEPGYQADCLVVRPEGWIAGLAPEQQISALLYTLRPQQIEHVYIAGRRVGP